MLRIVPLSESIATVESPRRFYQLDSLRGVAALTVVFFHFSKISSPRVSHVLLHTPLRIFIAGHQAVVLFFLLSGFVLTIPYQKRQVLGYGAFLVKRVCRIYLPYLGALALAVFCDMQFPSQGPSDNYWINFTWSTPVTIRLVVQHILFLGNYDWSQFNTVFWSLVYEMRISLVFPFIALSVLRGRARWTLLSAFALSLAAFPLALLFSRALHLGSYDAALNTTLTLHYAAFFILGSLMAKHLQAIQRWYTRLSSLSTALLAIAALLLYAFGDASSIIQRFTVPTHLYDWPVALGAMMIIVMAMNSQPFHRFLTSRAIHHLGKISYSLYLIHGTVLFALLHTLYRRIPTAVFLLLYLGITFAVTEIFHHLVEHPTMLLGRRLTTSSKVQNPARSAV